MESGKAIYVVFLLLELLLAFLAEKTRKSLFLIISIVFITVFAGLRDPSVGTDTQRYYAIINDAAAGVYYHNDVFFSGLSGYLMSLFGNTTIVMLLFSALIYSLLFVRLWDFKETISFTGAIFLFLCVYFPTTLSGIRQYSAVALVFFGTRYIDSRQYWKFFVCLGLATLLHLSGIIGIFYFAYAVWKNRKSSLVYNLAMFLSLPLLLLVLYRFSPDLSDRFSRYLESDSEQKMGLMVYFKLFSVLFLLFISKKAIKNKRYSLAVNGDNVPLDSDVLLFFLIAILISYGGYFMSTFARILWYFGMFEMVFWGQAFRARNNRLLCLVPMFIYAVYHVYHCLITDGNGLFPYIFVSLW